MFLSHIILMQGHLFQMRCSTIRRQGDPTCGHGMASSSGTGAWSIDPFTKWPFCQVRNLCGGSTTQSCPHQADQATATIFFVEGGSNYKIKILYGYKSLQVVCFFLNSFDNLCVSRNLSISSKLLNLLAVSCSQYSLIIPSIFVKTVTSPLLLLILVIHVFSPFFMIGQTVEPFLKESVLGFIKFLYSFLFTILLISTLVVIISSVYIEFKLSFFYFFF